MRVLAALVLLALAVPGCRREGPRPAAGDAGARAATPPRRVVSLAPSLTEIAFAIGAGSRVVGVDDFVEFPPEARSLPRVGGFLNPNFERILALKPDLVIMVHTFRAAADRLKQAGVPTAVIPAESLEDLDAAIGAVGRALGAGQAAEGLRARLRGELDAVAASVKGKPRPRVAFILDHRPGSLTDLYVAGHASFLARLVEIAGGENVFADIRTGAARIGVEEMLRRAPDVILDSTEDPELVSVWGKLPTLPAVKTGRVISVVEKRITVPGPRVGAAARYVAGLLHPAGTRDGG